jgi:hypothetical protein
MRIVNLNEWSQKVASGSWDKVLWGAVVATIVTVAYVGSQRASSASEGGSEPPAGGEGYVCSNTTPCFLYILPPRYCHRDGPCANYAT